eukprot:TRINITY_DN5960_c0_g1_i5.p1 TRINITY_DN5960_c0_g1~~TRINITY_DN5960_c0_g1_i5.p1  ORF type:complete len:209 (+),score=46.48 TRINITY_DN5960_c0_g1_i5:78-704(+)
MFRVSDLHWSSVPFNNSVNSLAFSVIVTMQYDKYDYHEVLLNTLFGLCPKGIGAHANRLFEYMKCATVPVMMSDNHVNPFEHELLDYRGLIIHFPEKDIWDMEGFFDDLKRLMDHHPQLLADLRLNLRTVWEKYFSSRYRHIDHTVRSLLLRLVHYHREYEHLVTRKKDFVLSPHIDKDALEQKVLKECGGDGFSDCVRFPGYQKKKW